MLKILHRVNTVEHLLGNPDVVGVELDIRSEGDRLILHHDPFQPGEDFETYLQSFALDFIILNIKAEGIEQQVLDLMEKYEVKDYFFLDISLPFVVKYMNKGWSKMAVRYSEHEPLELCLGFSGKVEWVWVDCFTHLPLDRTTYEVLKEHFKICLVSPELQGHALDRIEQFKNQMQGMDIDAVCTKRPDLW